MKTGNGVHKSRCTLVHNSVLKSRYNYTHYVSPNGNGATNSEVAICSCSVSHPVSQWNPVVRSTSEYGRKKTGNPLIRQ